MAAAPPLLPLRPPSGDAAMATAEAPIRASPCRLALPQDATVLAERVEARRGSHGGAEQDLATLEFGQAGSLKHRVAVLRGGLPVSPWHELPLHGPDGLLRCVCTTPAGTWLRHVAAQDEPFTPLQLAKDEGGRAAPFAHNAPWNVGLLPQTLGDVTHMREGFGMGGDGGALEVVDMGAERPRRVGEVYLVKPLGVFAAVKRRRKRRSRERGGEEEGERQGEGQGQRTAERVKGVEGHGEERGNGEGAAETDAEGVGERERTRGLVGEGEGEGEEEEEEDVLSWKVVGIAADDAMAGALRDVEDVHALLPGNLELIREWLRTCLTTENGDGEMCFGLNELAGDLVVTASVLAAAHSAWQLHPRHGSCPPFIANSADSPPSSESLEHTWASFVEHESDTCFPQSSSDEPLSSPLFDASWVSGQPAVEYAAAMKSWGEELEAITLLQAQRSPGTLQRAKDLLSSIRPSKVFLPHRPAYVPQTRKFLKGSERHHSRSISLGNLQSIRFSLRGGSSGEEGATATQPPSAPAASKPRSWGNAQPISRIGSQKEKHRRSRSAYLSSDEFDLLPLWSNLDFVTQKCSRPRSTRGGGLGLKERLPVSPISVENCGMPRCPCCSSEMLVDGFCRIRISSQTGRPVSGGRERTERKVRGGRCGEWRVGEKGNRGGEVVDVVGVRKRSEQRRVGSKGLIVKVGRESRRTSGHKSRSSPRVGGRGHRKGRSEGGRSERREKKGVKVCC